MLLEKVGWYKVAFNKTVKKEYPPPHHILKTLLDLRISVDFVVKY